MKVILEIQQYQQTPYCLEPVAVVQQYLNTLKFLEEVYFPLFLPFSLPLSASLLSFTSLKCKEKYKYSKMYFSLQTGAMLQTLSPDRSPASPLRCLFCFLFLLLSLSHLSHADVWRLFAASFYHFRE
jgi:hypothetical protein